MRAAANFLAAGLACLALGAAQLLPTLELARLGHRAAAGPATIDGWTKFIQPRALLSGDLLSLFVPNWPMATGSLNENFGYIGVVCILFVAPGLIAIVSDRAPKHDESTAACLKHNSFFAAGLALFGLLYAMATPLSKAFYLFVPGLSQMGGVGRALVLWSLGAALLAGFGLDFLRRFVKSDIVPLLALALLTLELFAAGWTLHPIAPRAAIYPQTDLTNWLQTHTRDGGRVLFLTPRDGWLPSEVLQRNGLQHSTGILPPNGATVYGLNDVDGYDSLAPRAYRDFVVTQEGADVSPPLNGNMILLNNPESKALDQLNVRYLVSPGPIDSLRWQPAFNADGCVVYVRTRPLSSVKPLHFYPGWRTGANGQDTYDPETFRFGLFLSLCAVSCGVGLMAGTRKQSIDHSS